MNGALGMAGIALGLAASVLGGVTLVLGVVQHRSRLVRSGTIYVWLVLAGAVLAVAAMERALITRDFSLTFVADNGSAATPALYNVASLWSALEGSILLWTIILAGYLVATFLWFRRRVQDPLVTWALVVLFAISAFFFLLLAGPANPFGRVSGTIPTSGPGPNPLLQNHPLMVIHPPMLYLGYVGFSVPFAFAIAGLVTGRVGEGWLLDTRRWTLFAWGFLSIGIVLGAWWSYEVLGWGGVWGWDPVENASLLPWLTATAFIHSVLVQERRGMLRVWNLSLLCATFCLTILGTFLTRSGVIESVHAFSDGPLGAYLLAFFALAAGTSVALIGWRGDRLRSPGSIDSPLSREGAFLANNLLFSLFAFVVLLGTVFPLIVEALQDRRLSVGRPFFDRMTTPLGLALLTLMAIAPVLPWRKASTELLRQRLFWPACLGVACIVVPVLLGADGVTPLLAFGLGGFAAGLRPAPAGAGHPPAGLAGPGRPGQRRHDRPPRDHRPGRGLRRADELPAGRGVPAGARRQRVVRRPHLHAGGPGARGHSRRGHPEGAHPDRRWSGLRTRPPALQGAGRQRGHALGPDRPHAGHLPDPPQAVVGRRRPRDLRRAADAHDGVALGRRAAGGRRAPSSPRSRAVGGAGRRTRSRPPSASTPASAPVTDADASDLIGVPRAGRRLGAADV